MGGLESLPHGYRDGLACSDMIAQVFDSAKKAANEFAA